MRRDGLKAKVAKHAVGIYWPIPGLSAFSLHVVDDGYKKLFIKILKQFLVFLPIAVQSPTSANIKHSLANQRASNAFWNDHAVDQRHWELSFRAYHSDSEETAI